MKAVILAISLFLPLSFSVASAQLTKMTVGYSAIAAGHLQPGWQKNGDISQQRSGCSARLFQRGEPWPWPCYQGIPR